MKLDDDDFVLLGLPRRYALDRTELDARVRQLQAQVHPDRFVTEGAAAQRVAMQWAVRVNEAAQRLRDPVRRGAYLCELAGKPIKADSNTAMPLAFLQQQMAWREALDDAADAAAVDALAEQVRAHEHQALEDLRAQLDEHADLPAAVAQVRALMFVRRLADEIEQRREAHSS
ncbi:MAG: Fe-S protein assembly co-chaperone HscB [Aquabacterium sp.]